MIEQIITSSVLIMAIWVLSLLMEKRINPCIKYALWILVAVKLLVPIPGFESAVSVMNAANKIEERGTRYLLENSGIIKEDAVPEEAYGHEEAAEVEKSGERAMQVTDFAAVCFWIWFAGAVLLAGVFVWSNLRFAGKLRNDRVRIGQAGEKINVYVVSGIRSPCLSGLFKPAIYLRKDSRLSEEQRKYVLAHEYTHYRHGDHVWALVRCMCVILYWYHPLVWMAAYRSIKDSELACDAGTLKIIGHEKRIAYGKMLIEIADEMSDRSAGIPVLECSTSAAGGIKEMRKRIRMIVDRPRTKPAALLVLALVCVGMVGCTFGRAVSEEAAEEDITDNSADGKDAGDEIGADTEKIEKAELQPERDRAVLNTDDRMYEEVILYEQAEEDKVCIRIQPSVLRDQMYYYYIPENENQEWLRNFMDNLLSRGILHAGKLKEMKETGWQIVYGDKRFMVLEGGYLYDYDSEEEYFVEAPKLCDYIQIMLRDKLDYDQFDPANIQNIVSAKLDVCSIFTNNEFYSQTITDEETLRLFEDWFGNAKYILGGGGCGNEHACLELTLADGKKIGLSMAIDSCSNFSINGVYYDYRPSDIWDNREFFECFDRIPFSY